MQINKIRLLLASSLMGLVLIMPVWAQEQGVDTDQPKEMATAAGQKQKIKGIIIRRDNESLIVREQDGKELVVNATENTKIEEKKRNPFRRSKNYTTTDLLRGLLIEVEGRSDRNGMLVAEKIKLTDDALSVAHNVESRVTPVEGRVGEAETRLSQAEQNAQRLSGQLEELQAISNAARGGAQAAQETADAALTGVQQTNERITNLISNLDEYEVKKGIAVTFKSGSSKLSPEAIAILDEIARQAKTERGYMIEVMGFASADGKEELNRRLSRERAEAVVRYLAEAHMIPLLRIVTPFGYGEAQPIADNETREGRQQNRRVEIKLLINRGLNSGAPVNKVSVNDDSMRPQARAITSTDPK